MQRAIHPASCAGETVVDGDPPGERRRLLDDHVRVGAREAEGADAGGGRASGVGPRARLGLHPEAELRKALDLHPQSPAARAQMGELALARGEHQRAVELLASVLEQVPAANRLHYPLGMAYRGLGQREKAMEHLGKVGVVGFETAGA